MRVLNNKFMNDLKTGSLSLLLEYIKTDDTLCLCIRENYINVYYRGGNLLEITQINKDHYKFKIHENYFSTKSKFTPNMDMFNNAKTCEDFVKLIPLLKQAIDIKFSVKHPLEREVQQLVLRENNHGKLANDTDYFITDIEYQDSINHSRFDMLAVKWLSTSSSRKKSDQLRPVLMELKYGDNVVSGKAGILKHFQDIVSFSKSGKLRHLIEETQDQFNQKISLGLEDQVSKFITVDPLLKPEYILLLANHKPVKSALNRELRKAIETLPEIRSIVDIKIAYSSMLGYGLFESKLMDLDDYLFTQKED